MAQDDNGAGAHPVPDGRVGRMLRLGGMTGGILGGMMASGLRQLARGERPSLPSTLLTPATASRITPSTGSAASSSSSENPWMASNAFSSIPRTPCP